MTQNQSPLPKEIRVQNNNIEPDKELPKVVQEPIKEEELFDFPMAMKKVAEGKKISKKEWESKDEYGILHKARLTLHKKEGTNHDWIPSEGDLMGTDWFIVD